MQFCGLGDFHFLSNLDVTFATTLPQSIMKAALSLDSTSLMDLSGGTLITLFSPVGKPTKIVVPSGYSSPTARPVFVRSENSNAALAPRDGTIPRREHSMVMAV